MPEVILRPRPASPLPPGAKNYLTAFGAEKLKQELDKLVNEDRPRLAAGGDKGNDGLQILQQRAEQIQDILQSAVVVLLPNAPDDVVRFGAAVVDI